MIEEDESKLEHYGRSIVSTPRRDVDEYSKLRILPYPQQSCTNLPYYFLEPEEPSPLICASHLQNFPLDHLRKRDCEKLKRLYVCLKEECGFKKYLLEAKRVERGHAEANRIYECEISASNFRIRHIKDDIIQYTKYLTKIYNLKREKFNSMLEAGLAAALSSSSIISCFGLASEALILNAHIYLWVWMAIFELLVVRMQTYVYLTLAKYAKGTGYTTWTFCPYAKGLGMSLVAVEFVGGLALFWEAPLSIAKIFLLWHTEDIKYCSVGNTLEEEAEFIGKRIRESDNLNILQSRCFSGPDDFTVNMVCPLTYRQSQIASYIFNSNLFNHLVKDTANMRPTRFTLSNILMYASTFVFWLLVMRNVKLGFQKLIQRMHHGTLIQLAFIIICFFMVTGTMDDKIVNEGTSAYFNFNGSFFSLTTILIAFRSSMMHAMCFYLDLGSKVPHNWNPEEFFIWKAIAHLTLHFFGMWLAYLAVYHEKAFYKSHSISCFINRIYLLNSALPRFLNSLGIPNTMAIIYYFIHAYITYIISGALLTIVWRNLSFNIQIFTTFPQIMYVFDVTCLAVILITMIFTTSYRDYWILTGELTYTKAELLSFLNICLDIAVLIYYGPSRVWTDLQFLTRRRVHSTIELEYIISIIITVFVVGIEIPRMLDEFMTSRSEAKLIICLLLGVPGFIVALNIISQLMREIPSKEVRQFQMWGKRSEQEQRERLRFNPAQFKTSNLKCCEVDEFESGDIYYMKLRKKGLISISKSLNFEAVER